HLDGLVHPEHGVDEVDPDRDQRVLATAGPAGGAAATAHPAAASTAEEGLEDVLEPAEVTAAEATHATGAVLVAGGVVVAPFVLVGEHLVGAGDVLELVGRVRVGVDVGVELAGQ